MAHGNTYEPRPSEEIASAVLSHDAPQQALTTLHSEWMTQKHELESPADTRCPAVSHRAVSPPAVDPTSARREQPMQETFRQFRSRQDGLRFRLGFRSFIRERMQEGRWSLADGATLRLEPRGAPLAIRCFRGTSIITQEGDPVDHVLEAGEALVTRSRGVVVVWAISDGELGARALDERARGVASRRRNSWRAFPRRTGSTTA
jgi:hypothetical protein